tara:strand:+ start:51349 stop:53619 length:2271 start_codon:yes stop_codon:yes gene_type:complete
MERHQVQKGFIDTALRVTAIATMIILTLCMASFGLSKLRLPAQSLAESNGTLEHPGGTSELPDRRDSIAPGASLSRPTGPDPLAEHLDRLGKRLEELASTVSRERATQSEIARLADSMQAARQQADLSSTKIQQELGNLRVTSEVELRDLNRQIDTVAEKSHRLEREVVEQRAGILSALENQRSTIASQVTRLEDSLNNVHTELSELRTKSQTALALAQTARLQPAGPLNALAPVPTSPPLDHEDSAEHDAIWQEPLILDSSASVKTPRPATRRATQTATSTGWKVSPMSHSAPQDKRPPRVTIPKPSLPPAPPAEKVPSILPPMPESSRRIRSSMIQAPLKSTLAPSVSARPDRVPDIIDLPSPDEPVITQISASSSTIAACSTRKYEVQTTVIHITADRPVDAEPAGVRMLNPELSTTAYGHSWSHDAVTHELLRKISLRTGATVAGRQQVTISSDSTEEFSIGSSCPHCNEVHGFEAGDRLILKAGSACDDVQRFHVVSQVVGGSNELDSLPPFDLTPVASQTYVIAEEAVEGTVEEAVATSDDKLVPIHGVLTPVSGPTRTKVSTQLMQRVVVMTFRDVNAAPTVTVTKSTRRILPPLPASKPAEPTVARKLTPVKHHPIFLPPPAPPTPIGTPQIDSNVEFVATTLDHSSPGIQRASHQQDDDYCEVCEKKHGADHASVAPAEEPDEKKQDKSLLDWFRRVRSNSPDSDSRVQNADFEVSNQKLDRRNLSSENQKPQRRYVIKPGNRRAVY